MKTLDQYMADLPTRFDESSVRKLIKEILHDAETAIDVARTEGHEEGYAVGHSDGHSAGYNDGVEDTEHK